MPFSGYLAAYVVMPVFSLEYIQSIIVVTSLFGVASIVIMAAAAYRLFAYACGDRLSGCCVAGVFVCLFFVAYKYFMPPGFSNGGPCLIYYYYIPNMLNLALLLALCRMHIMVLREPDHFLGQKLSGNMLREKSVYFAVFCVCAYMTQFSMITSAILPASFAGMVLFGSMLSIIRTAGTPFRGIRVYLRDMTCLQAMLFLLVALWFAAAIFELHGQRFESLTIGSSMTFKDAIISNLTIFTRLLSPRTTNLLAGLAVIAACLNVWNFSRGRATTLDKLFLQGTGCLICAFLIVLALNILVSYNTVLLGPRATFGLVCFVHLQLCVLLVYLACRIQWGKIVLPLFFLHVLVLIWKGPAWHERPRARYAEQMPVVQSWVHDVRQAAALNRDTVTLYTPLAEWPHNLDSMGEILFNVLRDHGILSAPMTIRLEQDTKLTR